jgi:hypothetical protein
MHPMQMPVNHVTNEVGRLWQDFVTPANGAGRHSSGHGGPSMSGPEASICLPEESSQWRPSAPTTPEDVTIVQRFQLAPTSSLDILTTGRKAFQ